MAKAISEPVDYRARFESMIDTVAAAAVAMSRADPMSRVYVIMKPAANGAWGEFDAVWAHDIARDGWELLFNEALPRDKPWPTWRSYIAERARRAPVIGN